MTRNLVFLCMLILISLTACEFPRGVENDDYSPTPEKFKRIEMPIITNLDDFIIEGGRQ